MVYQNGTNTETNESNVVVKKNKNTAMIGTILAVMVVIVTYVQSSLFSSTAVSSVSTTGEVASLEANLLRTSTGTGTETSWLNYFNASKEEQKKMRDDAKVVYIIRHGEKVYDTANITAYKYACLSEQGWSRGYHLNYVFGNVDGHNPNGNRSPDTMFAFNYDNGDLDCRSRSGDQDTGHPMYRTEGLIAPLGKKLGVKTLNKYGSKPDLCSSEHRGNCHEAALPHQPHDFGVCCNTGAAYAIKKALKDGSDSILVSWEHANIIYLVGELGGDSDALPYWPDIQYDIIYAMYFDSNTLDFMTTDTSLRQEFDWLGPSTPNDAMYANILGEKPGIN